MTDANAVPSAGGPQPQWFYLINNQRCGPVSTEQLQAMMRAGQAPPGMMVWREGFPQWIPAATASELTGGPPPLPGVTSQTEARRIRTAKVNCIAIFVLFCCWMFGIMLSCCGLISAHKLGYYCGCFIFLMIPYGAIYVPTRWRVLRSLPKGTRFLGEIGLAGFLFFLGMGILAAIFHR
jgi:hypothetical protein